jgi:hypothetical protein
MLWYVVLLLLVALVTPYGRQLLTRPATVIDFLLCRLQAAKKPSVTAKWSELQTQTLVLKKASVRCYVQPSSSSKQIDLSSVKTLVLNPDPPNTLESYTPLFEELKRYNVNVLAFETVGFGFSTPSSIQYDFFDGFVY